MSSNPGRGVLIYKSCECPCKRPESMHSLQPFGYWLIVGNPGLFSLGKTTGLGKG